MTWSYTGNPSDSAKDAIRFLIGDTDTTDQLLSNEEIAWTNLEASGTTTGTNALYEAAYRACIIIASSFTRFADKSLGDLSVSYSQRAGAYREQALRMKALASRSNSVPIPYAGGILISDKEIDQENSDIFSTWFASGQFEDVRDGGRAQTMRGLEYFGPGADR